MFRAKLAPAPTQPIVEEGEPLSECQVDVPAGMAHIYTECARIFNPIHTDASVARAAGLPEIILHGTATLALAVSRIIESEAGKDPARIERVAARFGAMVTMPSTLTVRVLARAKAHGRHLLRDVERRRPPRDPRGHGRAARVALPSQEPNP